MALPQIEILFPAIKRVRNYDCWVFKDELAKAEAAVPAGEVVEAVDRHGAFVAYAFYNPRSPIALRVVSTAKDHPVGRALLTQRLTQAITRREAITDTNAKRLVFSEADGLPGLIVDQYAEYLVVQFRSAGMDRLRSTIIELLNALVHPTGILERSDKEFREEEGLPPLNQVVQGRVPDRLLIEEGGLQFWVDPHHGLKTGFYLDQRTTRRKLREDVAPNQRVLDVFSYTGSLGIAAASRGAHVMCVEQEETFVALAKENASLNRVTDRMEFVAGNAFYWLEATAKRHRAFDWVVLDPPALTKHKTAVTKARQALHHLLVHGLSLVGVRGRLLLCVCSYHLLGLIEEITRIAAAERGDRVTVIDQWLQAADHPWILQIPATRYLMSWLCARDEPPAVSPTSTAR